MVVCNQILPANRRRARQPLAGPGDEPVNGCELDDVLDHSVYLFTGLVAIFVLI